MLAASANLPIVNFDLRTQFTVAPYVEPEPVPTNEVFIPEGETTFDNTDPNSLEVPGPESAPAADEVFENPDPAADPADNLVP